MYNFDGNNSIEYDLAFNHALQNGLCWIPWVGRDYSKQEHRLLVVGESHYASNNELPPSKQMCDIDDVAADKDVTREIVYESRICNFWSTPTLTNLNKVLVGCNNFDGRNVWNKIAFYNFIQRPMKTVSERPKGEDFAGGWRVFVDVVKVVNPTVCVFIGNTAANFFNEAMATLNITHEKVTLAKFINHAWAKKSAVTIEDCSIPIYSIRHTGRYFSWKVWHQYLSEEEPELMSFLKSQIECENANPDDEQDEIKDCEPHRVQVPLYLHHKPIIACNYEEINPDDYDDAKFISVGRAQYNNNEISVKIFRHTGKRWSRQSEEVPIQRLPYMLEMLLSAILRCQNDNFQSEMNEEIIVPEEIDTLRTQINLFRRPILESLNRIRALIEQIDAEKI